MAVRRACGHLAGMVLRHRRQLDGQLLRPGTVACCMSISRVPVHASDVSVVALAISVTAAASLHR